MKIYKFLQFFSIQSCLILLESLPIRQLIGLWKYDQNLDLFENDKLQNSDIRTHFDTETNYNLENNTRLIRYRQYNDKTYRRHAIPNQDYKEEENLKDKELTLNKHDRNNSISQKNQLETFQLPRPTKLGLRSDDMSHSISEEDIDDQDWDDREIGKETTEKVFDDDEYYDDDETTTTIPTTTPLRVLDEEEYEKALETDTHDPIYYYHFRERHGLIEPYQLPGNKKIDDLDQIKFCQCPRVYWPACATDGITYMNYCIMNCLDKVLRRYGPCIEYRRGSGIMANFF